MKKLLVVAVLAAASMVASCASNTASFSDSGRNNSHPPVKAEHSAPSHEAKSEHSFR